MVGFRHGRPRQELRYFGEKVRCWQGYDISIEIRRPGTGELCSDVTFENGCKIKINLVVNEESSDSMSPNKQENIITRMSERAHEQYVKYKQKGVEGVLQEPFFFPFSRTRRCKLVKGR